MPVKVKLYDLADGVEIDRNALTAQEAIENDPARYALAKPSPWPPVKKPSAPAPAKAAAEASTADAKAGADGPGDDLVSIIGIGTGIAKRLAGAGIATFAALAASTPEALAAAIKTPGFNAKKIADERWIEQAAAKTAPAPAETGGPAAE